MGQAKNRTTTFLSKHPVCAYCGGDERATTIDHCPPRAMFQNRAWPEGFEFPACQTCNDGTRNHDLLVAMLARMDPFEEKGNTDGRLVGLMKKVDRQFPGLLGKMMPTATEARRQNRVLGLQPGAGQLHQETGAVKVPEELHQAVCVVAAKLAKGVFYREAGRPFPRTGCLLLNWFTNAGLVRSGKYVVFDLLKDIRGDAPVLKRSGRYINDQFEYKVSLTPEKHIFVLQARFGNAFGLVVFGSTEPGLLERLVEKLRTESKRQGPFAVLQSTAPLQ